MLPTISAPTDFSIMKDAFGSTVESIRSGSNKKQAQKRVLDWEKKTSEHGKTKVPE